ncbi:MAG: hypothetical protein M3345_00700 [Actinomycetota bacterium]|nr:hypothetical protein [Actinomycetota bacterium]
MSRTDTCMEFIEDHTDEVCPQCGSEIVLAANGSRPNVEMSCACGTVTVLCA